MQHPPGTRVLSGNQENKMTSKTFVGILIAAILVLAIGHRIPQLQPFFTSQKTCEERHAPKWIIDRLGIDCSQLAREAR